MTNIPVFFDSRDPDDTYIRRLSVKLDGQLTNEQVIQALVAEKSGYALVVRHYTGNRGWEEKVVEGARLANYIQPYNHEVGPEYYIEVQRDPSRPPLIGNPIDQQYFNVINREAFPLYSNEPPSTSPGPLMDILTIAASVASVAQVVLMIVDMWSKKAKKKDVPKEKKNEASNQSEVKNIRALMSDGSVVQLDAWVTDPTSVKKFVDIFQSPSTSPHPIQIVFYLKNGFTLKVDLSDEAASREEFDMLIDYLGSSGIHKQGLIDPEVQSEYNRMMLKDQLLQEMLERRIVVDPLHIDWLFEE